MAQLSVVTNIFQWVDNLRSTVSNITEIFDVLSAFGGDFLSYIFHDTSGAFLAVLVSSCIACMLALAVKRIIL